MPTPSPPPPRRLYDPTQPPPDRFELLHEIDFNGTAYTVFTIPCADPTARDAMSLAEHFADLRRDLALPHGDGYRGEICALCPNYPDSSSCRERTEDCPTWSQYHGLIETSYVPVLLMRLADTPFGRNNHTNPTR